MADTSGLDLGKLLRLDEMVTQAAQTEAVRDSARALVRAYQTLATEIHTFLLPHPELSEEFRRLFGPLEDPGPFREMHALDDQMRLAAAAEEALMRIKLIGGWVKGLIRELTLEETMRLEAEAKVRLATKPPTGFSA